ncbi:MAG: Gfo/Idh/MocA family oxidoreductase [Phycisphaeraceae bacterium]|nr:Gfo/Idh/MocA family oxidoreductase [Phycisphaeraceae bacterium]
MDQLIYAMIGGGQGAFIGAVHRMAAALDQQATLVAGALSSTPEKSLASARALALPPDRSYPTWQAMLEAEAARPADQRLDFVSIVTPNDTHYPIARAFVDAGFNVILDKPMVHTSKQAADLVAAVERHGVVLAVTYNYTGYPLVREAARLVRTGALGTIRKVFVEYHQGWLATRLEASGQKQADWRTDPARSGIAGAVGDIGSHAENLVATITGLTIESLCADATTFVEGRRLDDDASVLLRFTGGARGVLTCSQVCVGQENNLSIRVYGTEGALAWRQEEPNRLEFTTRDGPRQVLTRGSASLGPEAAAATRLPAGHPEAFIEAFANIYRGAFEAIRARKAAAATSTERGGRVFQPDSNLTYPNVHDGARGVRFIEGVIASSSAGGVWTPLDNPSQ